MAQNVKPIELAEVRALAVLFSSPFAPDHRYVVLAEGSAEIEDYLAFITKYNGSTHKRATGLNLGGWEKQFFMVYCEDCFDPPIAIVRADGPCEAIDTFVDELNWSHISEEDAADYPEDDRHYGPSGQLYDGESVKVHEVKMVAIELA